MLWNTSPLDLWRQSKWPPGKYRVHPCYYIVSFFTIFLYMKRSHFFRRQLTIFSCIIIYSVIKKSNLHTCKHILFNFDTRFVILCDKFIFHNANPSSKVTFEGSWGVPKTEKTIQWNRTLHVSARVYRNVLIS